MHCKRAYQLYTFDSKVRNQSQTNRWSLVSDYEISIAFFLFRELSQPMTHIPLNDPNEKPTENGEEKTAQINEEKQHDEMNYKLYTQLKFWIIWTMQTYSPHSVCVPYGFERNWRRISRWKSLTKLLTMSFWMNIVATIHAVFERTSFWMPCLLWWNCHNHSVQLCHR